ncbi:hypothetical protein DM02DRAFT_517809 [Periconia macrospinosa]|uniref:Prion-inhibition and propagation HeLo domain-containing protein n=1 Tax=Periconia macrospinosa TaxID=97972 RepID=A0A2V1E406_9PLEO|nr:hypothetical protein DM02DRAFT_517809 [Periconia macrospinosa]
MAELALAAVSLTFQVFSGCIQGYELITDAKHMPSDCQYLRVRLKTEQYRLLDWAEIVRLDETDDNLLISNSSKGLLLDVLDQQRRLINQFGRLDDKYRKLARPLLVDYEEGNNNQLPDPPAYKTEEENRSVQRADSDFRSRFPQSHVLLKKSLQWAKQSTGYPKRLKWATFDKAKMENLALKLASFNDFMQNMLNTQQLENLVVKQTRTEYQIMQLNSTINNLVQLFKSTNLQDTRKDAGSPSRRRSKQLTSPIQAYMQARGLDDASEEEEKDPLTHPNLAALAQFKALNSAIQDPSIFTDEFTSAIGVRRTASETLNVELNRSHIHLLDPPTLDHDSEPSENSQRAEAYYHPPHSRKLSVWIEWKTYEPAAPFHSNGAGGDPDPKILERVKALAALLKENNATNQFRAPHCLGYFRDASTLHNGDDNCRFGLVFEKPQTVHSSTRPRSLHTLLTTYPTSIPSLTSRIILMRRLAETLERLHAVNWLHKGLRSANILFFTDGDTLDDIDFADPYVSGFDYSRPSMSDDMTEKPPENAAEDIYRHPNCQGAGGRDVVVSTTSTFKKSYDIYALGVLFVEIAYWKPINSILGIERLDRAKPRDTYRVRERLLSENEGVLRYVRSFLGEKVEGVVRACLEGPAALGVKAGLDERRDEVGVVLQRGFFEKVVGVLEGVKV